MNKGQNNINFFIFVQFFGKYSYQEFHTENINFWFQSTTKTQKKDSQDKYTNKIRKSISRILDHFFWKESITRVCVRASHISQHDLEVAELKLNFLQSRETNVQIQTSLSFCPTLNDSLCISDSQFHMQNGFSQLPYIGWCTIISK